MEISKKLVGSYPVGVYQHSDINAGGNLNIPVSHAASKSRLPLESMEKVLQVIKEVRYSLKCRRSLF